MPLKKTSLFSSWPERIGLTGAVIGLGYSLVHNLSLVPLLGHVILGAALGTLFGFMADSGF